MAESYRNPFPTVDIIIEHGDGIVLIQRKNPPYGWALPGGFVDWGESLESAAVREAREETCLDIRLAEQFHTYSEPDRDPRHPTITTVYIATGSGEARARDDARHVAIFKPEKLPSPMAFDHDRIIADYRRYRAGESLRAIFSDRISPITAGRGP